MHFIQNLMNCFQFNSIQFAVWYWGISLLCLMKFWKRLSFLSYSFKREITWQTSFSSRLTSYFQPITISNNDFIVDFLLQHFFIFQQFEPSFTFTFDPIIAILKSRHSLSSFHPTTMTVLSTFHHKDSFKWIDYHFQSVVFNLNIFREWGRENWERERNKLNNNMISSWIIFISTWWKL